MHSERQALFIASKYPVNCCWSETGRAQQPPGLLFEIAPVAPVRYKQSQATALTSCTSIMASKRKHDEAFNGPPDDASAPTRLPRASQEIVTYFEELKTHFDGLVDKEEQSLLVANALEEASGQECAVATDPVCSRVLEALLPAAEPPQLANFFQAVLKGEGLIAIASRCSLAEMSDIAASRKMQLAKLHV